jgi:predicted RecA/RadA family phage recombinase
MMAKTARILKDGRKMDFVATADVSNGDVVPLTAAVVIPHADVVAGETCAGDYTGTIEIAGATPDAFTQGKICFYDVANKQALNSNTGSDPILGLVVTGKAGSVEGVIAVDIGVRG